MLYTRETGSVASKREAAAWAGTALDGKWRDLVARAWRGRENPDAEPTAEDINTTLEFMRYAAGRV
jgi:hypothetical protein